MPSEPQSPFRLENLEAQEVSLVDRGAIQRPFLVIKSADKNATPSFELTNAQEKTAAKIIRKAKALLRKDDAAMGDDGELDTRAESALRAVYRILCPFKGMITESMLDEVLDALDLDGDLSDETEDTDLADAAEDADDAVIATPATEGLTMADNSDQASTAADWSPVKTADMSDEDYAKALAAAKMAFSNAVMKADGDAKKDDDKDKISMNKADDEEDKKDKKDWTEMKKGESQSVERQIQKAKEQTEREWVAKTQALESRLAHLETERVLKSYEEKIVGDCQTLGKDAVAQARIIKSQYDVSQDAGDAYLGLLKDSAAMMKGKAGIFKNVGTSYNQGFGGSVSSESGTPQQQYQSMVRAQIEKGLAKSEVEANAQVLATQPGQDAYNLMHGGRN